MDVQQKIVTAAIAIVLIFVVNSAMAYGEKHGYQAPIGGNGVSEGYAQETLGNPDEGMSGDDHEMENEGNW